MTYLTTIELGGEELSFSIAHFTIFSATQRERLHGHNYLVQAAITLNVQDIGLAYDYAIYRTRLLALCHRLDTHMLLPTQCPLLKIREDETYYYADYGNDKMSFLKKDTLLMPLINITLEELSRWFIQRFTEEAVFTREYQIKQVFIKVWNGPGQCASAEWRA